MRLYQDAFHNVIDKALDPQKLLVKIFTAQLKKAGYTLDENQLQHLIDEEELEEFKQSEQEVIDELALDETEAKFYKKDYGWASTPNCLDPNFVDIARKAGFNHMSPYVKWASHNIHAGPTQFHTSLALTGIEDNLLVTGTSTQGLTIPGHSTAVSIMQLTTLFLNFENTIDNIALCKVLSALNSEIGQSFLEAEELVSN